MCSLDSEMRTDGQDSVLSFHASYGKNLQKKTGERAAGAHPKYFRNNVIITIKECGS